LEIRSLMKAAAGYASTGWLSQTIAALRSEGRHRRTRAHEGPRGVPPDGAATTMKSE
jgi:hypothetical protein